MGLMDWGFTRYLKLFKRFPRMFPNFVILQVGVIDMGNFKGLSQIESLRQKLSKDVDSYLSRRNFCVDSVVDIGIDVVETGCELVKNVAKKFPNAIFLGDKWF